MNDSDGKGSGRVIPRRSSKLVLPPRTTRPSDDEFFDTVLRSVEQQAEEGGPDASHDHATSEPDSETEPTAQVSPPITDEALMESSTVVAGAPELEKDQQADRSAVSTTSHAPAVEITSKVSPASVNRGGAEESVSFQEFEKRWTHFLSNTLMNLCKEIHRNTVEMNQPTYDTTARELCEKVGRSKRHTFLLLQQLETMGFVRRKEIREKNRLIGIRIWFHVSPLQK